MMSAKKGNSIELLAFFTIPLVMLNPFDFGFLGIMIMFGLIVIQWKGRGRLSQS